MSEKSLIETPTTGEDLINLLFKQYENELEDPLLNQIKSEIEKSWDDSEVTHKEVSIRLEEFLKALRDYHNSYSGLKAAARKERMLQVGQDRYVSAIQNADRREKILHDNFISSANILSRTMKKANMDNHWRGNDMIYNQSGENDSSDLAARDKFREWMFSIYHEKFNS